MPWVDSATWCRDPAGARLVAVIKRETMRAECTLNCAVPGPVGLCLSLETLGAGATTVALVIGLLSPVNAVLSTSVRDSIVGQGLQAWPAHTAT